MELSFCFYFYWQGGQTEDFHSTSKDFHLQSIASGLAELWIISWEAVVIIIFLLYLFEPFAAVVVWFGT